jgi:TolA-binding protein
MCLQYSSPTIRSYNEIAGQMIGVEGDDTSLPNLGQGANRGNNSITDNWDYEVYSDNSSTLYAEYNYWGPDDPPDPSVTEDVDWEPYLEDDPLSKAKAQKQKIPKPQIVINPEDTVGVSEFNEAHLTYLKGETDDALDMFSALVDKYPDYNMGRQSLAFENRKLRNENKKAESESRLLTVSSSYEGKEISGLANSIRIGQLVKNGDYKEPISLAKDIVSKFPKTDLEKYSLYDLGTIHWYYLNDQKTGESYYRQLIANYPKDDLSSSALATLGEWVSPEKEEKIEKIIVINTIPSEFILDQNYPNPFNPTTTIKYELPEDVHVVVSIYNMKGQLVARLVDEQKNAGHHLVKWNATEQPSGMYVYKMEAGDFASTRKLMLLK